MSRQPSDNRRGEVLAAAKHFDKIKDTPNNLVEATADGSFCMHDLMEALPHLKNDTKAVNNKWWKLYNIVKTMVEREQLTKLMGSYPCKSNPKRHSHYRYNDPFRKPDPAPEKTRTVNIDTGKVSQPETPEAPETPVQQFDTGEGRVREINIKINDREIQLQIRKGVK